MRRSLTVAMLAFVVLAALPRTASGAPVRVVGTVVDGDGEPIVGAVVSAGTQEATTDERGRFVITADDRGELVVFAEGFAPYTARPRATLAITLAPAAGELVEVEGAAPEETKPTEYKLGADEIRTTPGAMNDALRAVTILPAAARIPYSFGGLVLRGMSPRDTSVFVDGVEIPIAFHFGGISSVFPTSLLEDLRVVPSGFDVSLGRTQGGVIELTSRTPRRDRYRVGGELSLLHAAASAEGPAPGGGAFLLGIRRSYLDLAARPFLDRNDPAPSYLDGQARAVWGTIPTGRLTTYVLASLDQISNDESAATPMDPDADGHFAARLGFVRLGADYRRRVGQTTVSVSPHVGTNLLSIYEKDYDGGINASETRIRRGWYLWGARGEWLRDDPGGFLRAGVDVSGGYLGRVDGDVVLDDVDDADEIPLPRNTVLWTDAAVWAEARRKWRGDKLSLRPGVRVDRFGLGEQTTLDLRLNAHATLTDALTLRGSVGRFHQPPSPAHFDEFLDNLDAQASFVDQATLALEWTGGERLGAWLAAFWHEGRRTLVDAPDDDDDDSLELDEQVFRELLEEQVGFYGDQRNQGAQRSYGLEATVRYQTGRLRVLATYAWSRAKRRYLVPDRAWTPYLLDQPVRLNLVAAMRLGKWNLGVRLNAVSGNPVRVFPEGTPYDAMHADEATAPLSRMPTFWQIDVRFDRTWRPRWGTLTLYVDILNVTNHRNVEMRQGTIELVEPDYLEGRWGYDDTRGLPIIPSIGVEVTP
jgi:hypothetical protein